MERHLHACVAQWLLGGRGIRHADRLLLLVVRDGGGPAGGGPSSASRPDIGGRGTGDALRRQGIQIPLHDIERVLWHCRRRGHRFRLGGSRACRAGIGVDMLGSGLTRFGRVGREAESEIGWAGRVTGGWVGAWGRTCNPVEALCRTADASTGPSRSSRPISTSTTTPAAVRATASSATAASTAFVSSAISAVRGGGRPPGGPPPAPPPSPPPLSGGPPAAASRCWAARTSAMAAMTSGWLLSKPLAARAAMSAA